MFHIEGPLRPLILNVQLRSDILNFDVDAFITAATRYRYKEPMASVSVYESLVIWTFRIWMSILAEAVRYIQLKPSIHLSRSIGSRRAR